MNHLLTTSQVHELVGQGELSIVGLGIWSFIRWNAEPVGNERSCYRCNSKLLSAFFPGVKQRKIQTELRKLKKLNAVEAIKSRAPFFDFFVRSVSKGESAHLAKHTGATQTQKGLTSPPRTAQGIISTLREKRSAFGGQAGVVYTPGQEPLTKQAERPEAPSFAPLPQEEPAYAPAPALAYAHSHVRAQSIQRPMQQQLPYVSVTGRGVSAHTQTETEGGASEAIQAYKLDEFYSSHTQRQEPPPWRAQFGMEDFYQKVSWGNRSVSKRPEPGSPVPVLHRSGEITTEYAGGPHDWSMSQPTPTTAQSSVHLETAPEIYDQEPIPAHLSEIVQGTRAEAEESSAPIALASLIKETKAKFAGDGIAPASDIVKSRPEVLERREEQGSPHEPEEEVHDEVEPLGHKEPSAFGEEQSRFVAQNVEPNMSETFEEDDEPLYEAGAYEGGEEYEDEEYEDEDYAIEESGEANIEVPTPAPASDAPIVALRNHAELRADKKRAREILEQAQTQRPAHLAELLTSQELDWVFGERSPEEEEQRILEGMMSAEEKRKRPDFLLHPPRLLRRDAQLHHLMKQLHPSLDLDHPCSTRQALVRKELDAQCRENPSLSREEVEILYRHYLRGIQFQEARIFAPTKFPRKPYLLHPWWEVFWGHCLDFDFEMVYAEDWDQLMLICESFKPLDFQEQFLATLLYAQNPAGLFVRCFVFDEYGRAYPKVTDMMRHDALPPRTPSFHSMQFAITDELRDILRRKRRGETLAPTEGLSYVKYTMLYLVELRDAEKAQVDSGTPVPASETTLALQERTEELASLAEAQAEAAQTTPVPSSDTQHAGESHSLWTGLHEGQAVLPKEEN